MATPSTTDSISSPSLEPEFQLLFKPNAKGQLECSAKNRRFSKKKPQAKCQNPLGKDVADELHKITSSILTMLKARDEVEELVRRLSVLALCKGIHQKKSESREEQVQKWTKLIDAWKLENLEGERTVESISPYAGSDESENDATTPSISSSEKEPVGTTTSYSPTPSEPLCPQSLRSPLTSDFEDDSGYISDYEREPDNDKPVRSAILEISGSLASNKDGTLRTPKQSRLIIPNDSGVSMSYGTSSSPNIGESIEPEDPPSPLARKATKRNGDRAATKQTRPAPTPVQPPRVDSLITGSEREFRLFSKWSHFHNSTLLKKFMKESIKLTAQRQGTIYGFQVPGCSLIKIGQCGVRKGETIESTYQKRISERKGCGWPRSTDVFHEQVTYPYRMERIIHYHLHAAIRKEVSMEKRSNGRTCKHGHHQEWFDVPVDKAKEVVRAWKRWNETTPYFEDNKKITLRKEWKENLEEVNIEDPGDHWLHWLNEYVPEKPAQSIGKFHLEKGSDLKIEDSEDKCSDILAAKTAVKEEHEDEDGITAPRRLPTREEFRRNLEGARSRRKKNY